jgi:stage II sporulation protein D
MSQSGAKGMALAGYTYKDILEYYYKGVEVK